jgi:hypothetical protein
MRQFISFIHTAPVGGMIRWGVLHKFGRWEQRLEVSNGLARVDMAENDIPPLGVT